MFVDASAIVAVLTREAEADEFLDIIDRSSEPITSPIAVFESCLGLCRKRHASVEEAHADVREFLMLSRIECVAISAADSAAALSAFARYGKGRGHPAQLNLGDCFAYAVARNRAVPLLFKGDDFTKTDIAVAFLKS